MAPFTQYKQWMMDRYGEPLFRVPVQLASSCPHGRCAFCSENGSKAQQTQQQENPIEQIEAAIRFSKRRYKATKLMLYIQAFTADLTDPEQQQLIFQCLEKFDFEAISIGTRPDCLPPEALNFLEALKDKVEVWVELGVQTTNDETLKTINRGHDWACSKQAILDLAERGIHVAPHIILGLPNEVSTDWKNTADELAKLPISGIKIHNLHIMKGTEFAKTMPPAMNHWEYAEALMDFLRRIPADIPVIRISTDTPDDQLIAPHWHLEKGQFLDYVIQQMTCRQISQGDQLEAGQLKLESEMVPVQTDDGSITFFSNDWKEHYHTKSGARLEAEKKFVEPSGLASKLQDANLKLLDVCFGLGNNSLAALGAADGAKHTVDITALEMDKRVVRAAAEHFQPLETDPVDWQETLQKLLDAEVLFPMVGKIDLRFGDARWLIQNLPDDSFDIVFHDPFSSQHCPELWTVEFFQQLYRVMKPNGVLCTYSSSQPVRGAMLEAGFVVGETHPGHQMGDGTIASPSTLPPEFPTIGTLDKRRSIPYRDEFLCATSKAILRQRQEAIEVN
ncbi:MAG: TIGR01212 family radical SAM protein [Verrucomicrobia bacterium]|nr:TIGR01212 family radical SAM protein [Verrucomicrobiota bacterium]